MTRRDSAGDAIPRADEVRGLETFGRAREKRERLALPGAQPQRHSVFARGLESLDRQRGHANRTEPTGATAGLRGRGHRRHRCGKRRPDSAGVVVGHPGREPDDLLGKERLGIEEFDDRFDGRRWRFLSIGPIDDAAGKDAIAERHEHAGADDGRLELGGQAVGQAVERGHGHRDANEAHWAHSPPARSSRRSARTFFMSSQTSRLRSGLRSRNAG